MASYKTNSLAPVRMRMRCKAGGNATGRNTLLETKNVEGRVAVPFARIMIDAIGLKSSYRGKVSNPLRKCDVQVVLYDVHYISCSFAFFLL